MISTKHVVFLQGMPSQFFTGIAETLNQSGCRTTAIHFCAGDALFNRASNIVKYRGKQTDWLNFIEKFMHEKTVTDLVLLGEQRNYHKQAIAIAKKLGITVTVTDFGYLRPDWITLEQDGMAGKSKFPKDQQEVADLAQQCPEPDLTPRYRDSTWRMAVNDLLYSFSNVLLWWMYPHYKSTIYRPHPFVYFPFMGWQMLWAGRRNKKAVNKVATLLSSKKPYFIFPLQLEHDFQVIAYSDFKSLNDALKMIFQSFASYADNDMRLAIKLHPWDPGFINWEKKIRRLAEHHKLEERIYYFNSGNLMDMVAGSHGMVTVNSTSAIQALQAGKPVSVLGQAIYDMPSLTNQSGLDSFWKNPVFPDPENVRNFIRALAGSIQIRGVFFNKPGLHAAIKSAAARIHAGTVGKPMDRAL